MTLRVRQGEQESVPPEDVAPGVPWPPLSEHVWRLKYRATPEGGPPEESIGETWRRVARALARAEPREAAAHEERFLGVLRGFRFLPGGRILAGAGTGRRVTLFNCFVMGAIEDAMDSIFAALRESALTMQEGGGVGLDFSTLRPRGSRARSTGMVASGPVSFMRIWDTACEVLLSTGTRRGAMMATLRCDHPDVEEFISAKQAGGVLRHFNLSVLATDAFLAAVERDEPWPLVFPTASLPEDATGEVLLRRWSGGAAEEPCRVLRRVPARALWERMVQSAHASGEPGILFIDRINRTNNLWYREHLSATNPCGEVPLPPYGSCDLGSLNLTRFVREPFTPAAHLDFEALRQTVEVAVRMLDDVIDVSRFPLEAQAAQERATRRLGLGVTGLADALALLGLHYGSAPARELAARVLRELRDAAYRASIRLAGEKGPFPAFEAGPYLEGPFVQALPEDVRAGIVRSGLRNSHLVAIAPAGSISLLAGVVSSGVEPTFALRYRRRLREPDGTVREHVVTSWALRLWQEQFGPDAPLPPFLVDDSSLTAEDHLAMVAALQPYVDSAISKTLHLPEGMAPEALGALFTRAYALGLKGCTVFPPRATTGAVLEPLEARECCPRCTPTTPSPPGRGPG